MNWRKALNFAFPLHGYWVNYVHNQWSKWKSQKTGGPEFMAVYGRSIPVLYGRPKISGPLLIYTRAVSTTNIPIVVVLGEAGVTQIDTTTWGAKDYAGGGPGGSQVFTVKDGTQTTPVTSGDPTRALAYKRTSLAVIDGTVTLPGATVPGLAFVVRGKLDSTGNSSTGDADPDQVIADMLTNTTYGLGWPSSRLTTDEWGIDSALGNRQNASYNKWLASGPIDFSFSRAITESRPTKDYLEEFLDATHSTASAGFKTDGTSTVFIVPRGDTSTSGGFVPVTTVRYALTEADLIPNDEGGLVEMTDDEGEGGADLDNTLIVSFTERDPTDSTSHYIPGTVEVEDPVAQARDGLKRGPTVDLPCITRRAHATGVGKMLLKHSLYRERGVFRFRVGWRFARLDPLDYVTVPVGATTATVQIAKIEEDEEFALTITGRPALLPLGQSVEHVTQSSDGANAPDNVPVPKVIDAHLRISNTGTVTVVSGAISASRVAATPDYLAVGFDVEWQGAYSVALTEYWDTDGAPMPTIDDRPAVVSAFGVTSTSCNLVFYDVWNGANKDPLQSSQAGSSAKLNIKLRFTGFT